MLLSPASEDSETWFGEHKGCGCVPEEVSVNAQSRNTLDYYF